jgi:(p)ppGpp synthase/HD superfamily hydrolase
MLTDRFAEALTYAERLHRKQTRKGNDIPYVAHLMAVSATVLEWGGDEDIAIAALLHDAVEDQGGVDTLREIEARFGGRVAGIVMGCTDSTSSDLAAKAPWEERKRHHVAELAQASPDIALVTAADKLHNLTAMIRDVRKHGPATMRRQDLGVPIVDGAGDRSLACRVVADPEPPITWPRTIRSSPRRSPS